MARPTLWHLAVSHYSEKARWALDLKGVGVALKTAPPGVHMLVSAWLTRGASNTFPVLRAGGATYADSSEIVAFADRAGDGPLLLPEDSAERARALELEQFCDESLGPQIRRLGFYSMLQQASTGGGEALREVASSALPRRLGEIEALHGPAAAFGSVFAKARYRAHDPAAAEECRAGVLAALDRLESELGDREYLVGDSFTVADLTAAALFYPLVRPPEAPQVIETPPEPLLEWWAPHAERPGPQYVRRMFASHR